MFIIDNIKKVIKRDFKIFLILFLVGNFSFINNSLNIASPSWYRIYGWDSEQLVLDGILNSDKKIIDIVNKIAPEHLELNVKNYKSIVSKIKNSGSICLGK